MHRHGSARGTKRYRCRACGGNFTALTGTPLARLRHRDKWLDQLEGMLEGRSVRGTADRIGVHRNTGFRWRHRFPHPAKDERAAALRGIAWADEPFLPESRKGPRRLDRPARHPCRTRRRAGGPRASISSPAGAR